MLKLFEEKGFVPRRCTWEITLACDLRCGHCGSRAGQARPDELNTAEALSICDQLAQLGTSQVTLAGGEPTLRPDWAEIVARLRGHGVRVSILSNGYTWSAEAAKRAKEAGIT
ncbi:MAG: radical SAM protein, partial [Myxococcota bacterium]|nr:radical SAM protein [Myxococcota bacterium]